jgi:hypothetical protein
VTRALLRHGNTPAIQAFFFAGERRTFGEDGMVERQGRGAIAELLCNTALHPLAPFNYERLVSRTEIDESLSVFNQGLKVRRLTQIPADEFFAFANICAICG